MNCYLGPSAPSRELLPPISVTTNAESTHEASVGSTIKQQSQDVIRRNDGLCLRANRVHAYWREYTRLFGVSERPSRRKRSSRGQLLSRPRSPTRDGRRRMAIGSKPKTDVVLFAPRPPDGHLVKTASAKAKTIVSMDDVSAPPP